MQPQQTANKLAHTIVKLNREIEGLRRELAGLTFPAELSNAAAANRQQAGPHERQAEPGD